MMLEGGARGESRNRAWPADVVGVMISCNLEYGIQSSFSKRVALNQRLEGGEGVSPAKS